MNKPHFAMEIKCPAKIKYLTVKEDAEQCNFIVRSVNYSTILLVGGGQHRWE